MDKIDHKRMQTLLRKKIDNLEEKLEKNKKREDSPENTLGPLFVKNYNTCASCNS